jgi:hypothetical protein
MVNRLLPMFCSEFGPGLDHPRSLSDDQNSASSNSAEGHYSGLVIKTLPASYHRPELDLTKEIVAFKATDTEQATSCSLADPAIASKESRVAFREAPALVT